MELVIGTIGEPTDSVDKYGIEIKSGDVVLDIDGDFGIVYWDTIEGDWMIKWLKYETPSYLKSSGDFIIKAGDITTISGLCEDIYE